MRRIAVIFGAGPGTGAALARLLSQTHSLLLLSPSLPKSLPKLKLPEKVGDNVLALSSNGSNDSLKEAFGKMKETWPDGVVDVGICNTGSGDFKPGSFLDQSEQSLRENMERGLFGAWAFAQHVIPHLLASPRDPKGTLIFTGATMALRGGANFSAMAPPMFARRSLAQSLAREFGPKGVHVAFVVLDGVIETERTSGFKIDSKLVPDEIAQAYLSLINQPKNAWTQEMDLRPYNEKW